MKDTLLKVFRVHNNEFAKLVAKGERSQNTYNKYKAVHGHLAEFIRLRYFREDLAFKELTADFIHELDSYLRVDKACTHNTI